MNDATKFDYDNSEIDINTTVFLKEKEKNIYEITTKAITDLGKEYMEARDILANHDDGLFLKWIATMPHSKSTVYRMIQRYENLVLPNWEDLDLIEMLPDSLTYEMSKPSANPVINEMVMNEEITTHKEYVEMEKKLKELEEQNNKFISKIEQLSNQQPLEIIKEIEKEVVPKDYQQLKEKIIDIEKANDYYKKRSDEMYSNNLELAEENRKLKKVDENEFDTHLHMTVTSFNSHVQRFIEKVGGMVWINDYFGEMTEFDRKVYNHTLKLIEGWLIAQKENLKEE